MISNQHKTFCIQIQLKVQFQVFWKAIMQRFLHMVKQALVKLTQWKDLSILAAILKEELYLDQWNRFSNTLRM